MYEQIGREIGAMVNKKQAAYGDSFGKSGNVLRILYPNGIQPDQYDDALTVTRIVDKLFRIATDRDALGESPYRDIAGYGILGAAKHHEANVHKTLPDEVSMEELIAICQKKAADELMETIEKASIEVLPEIEAELTKQGYRLLKEGEAIPMEGVEYLMGDNSWYPRSGVADDHYSARDYLPMRVKLKYRLLQNGEPIETGDQVKYDASWVTLDEHGWQTLGILIKATYNSQLMPPIRRPS